MIAAGFSLLLAFVVSALLVVPLRRRGPGPASGFVFFLLSGWLVTWAGALWAAEVEAELEGLWLPLVAIALVYGLLLLALLPPEPRMEAGSPPASRQAVVLGVRLWFWLLAALLLALILLR